MFMLISEGCPVTIEQKIVGPEGNSEFYYVKIIDTDVDYRAVVFFKESEALNEALGVEEDGSFDHPWHKKVAHMEVSEVNV